MTAQAFLPSHKLIGRSLLVVVDLKQFDCGAELHDHLHDIGVVGDLELLELVDHAQDAG